MKTKHIGPDVYVLPTLVVMDTELQSRDRSVGIRHNPLRRCGGSILILSVISAQRLSYIVLIGSSADVSREHCSDCSIGSGDQKVSIVSNQVGSESGLLGFSLHGVICESYIDNLHRASLEYLSANDAICIQGQRK